MNAGKIQRVLERVQTFFPTPTGVASPRAVPLAKLGLKIKIEIVMTGSAPEPLEWQDHIRNKAGARRWLSASQSRGHLVMLSASS